MRRWAIITSDEKCLVEKALTAVDAIKAVTRRNNIKELDIISVFFIYMQ